MRKWKCLVCGYTHEDDEPPEKCPVCDADKSKFEEIFEEEGEKCVSSQSPTIDRLPQPTVQFCSSSRKAKIFTIGIE
jgi:rubredoxin